VRYSKGMDEREKAARWAAVDAKVARNVDEYGWAVQGVFPPSGSGPWTPPFAYTVGLMKTLDGHPELMIVGLDPGTMQRLLNEVASRAQKLRRPVELGRRYDDILNGGLPAEFVRVSEENVATFTGMAARYYRLNGGPERVEALQMVWPDPAGRLPWDEGFDHETYDALQPVLGKP
jgi:hypothetical protein